MTEDDLQLIKQLGKGAFGKVMLTKYKKSNEYYAVKILEKSELLKNNGLKHAFTEKNILLAIEFPFIIFMISYFETKQYLYFVLQLVPCGDLSDKLIQFGKFDEQLSRFYAAQILLAIEFLHYIDIVYRDLKPENILLDTAGYIKLTDFGLSKYLQRKRTYTFCGTPEYIAPEIILSKGYGKSADFWAFGILLFELNAGYSPFYAKDNLNIFAKITAGIYTEPEFFSNELKDVIKNLLQANITKRYGIIKGGFDKIKNHKWFDSISWLPLANKGIKAPYVPRVTINQ